MKVKIIFAWYDFWIGLFYDQQKKRLYVFPIPMIGIRIDFKKEYKPFSNYGGTKEGIRRVNEINEKWNDEFKNINK